MSDKIQESYRQSRNIYDDVLTRSHTGRLLLHKRGVSPHRLADDSDPVQERMVHSSV